MSFVLLCKRYLVPLPFHPAPLTWGTPHCPVPQHPAPDAWTLYPQIATTRRLTVHFNPPSSCILEISVRGVKICVRAEDAQEAQVWPPDSGPPRPPSPASAPQAGNGHSAPSLSSLHRVINVATFSS